jgi:tetratricopeptide (TPR) repeat protein
MRTLLACACLLSISALTALGQAGGGGGRRPPGGPTRPRIPTPDLTPNTMIFLTGKVVIDDGSVLTEPAAIQTICKGQKRTETHTDSHGSFSFQFGGISAASSGGDFDADTPFRNASGGRPDRRNLHDCELQASLAGFTSDSISLGGRFSGDQSADIGRVVLHRLANVAGFTISATSAQAPGSARKALEKGQEQQKKGKWDDSQKSLEKAVTIYPKFAAAWFELGRVQLQKNDPAGARHSFQQSLAADSKYINPYHGLTQLAMRERNWKELTEFSDKLLTLNPVNFPEAWLSNAIGNYCLQNFAAAEKSARRGLQVDTEHRVPKLEYLLGITLGKRFNYEEAAQHLRAFLSLTSKPADIAEAQKQLDEIARLSATANLTTGEKK